MSRLLTTLGSSRRGAGGGGGGGGALFSERASVSHILTNLSTSITVNKPAGTAEGDLLVAFVTSEAVASGAWAMPTGWALAREYRANNVLASTVWKIATASEPSTYTFTMAFSINGYNAAVICAIAPNTGLAWPASPVDATVDTYQSASTTSHPAPTVTVAAAGALVFHGWFTKNGGRTFVVPSELLFSATASNGNNAVIAGGLGQAAAGVSVAVDAETTIATDNMTMMTASFNPPV